MTVDWTSVERVQGGQALACPPEVAKWLHDKVVQRLSSVAAALGSAGVLSRDDQVRGRAELEMALGALRVLLNERIEQPPDRRFRTVVEAVRAGAPMPDERPVQLDILGDAEISSRAGELIADFVAEVMRNVVKHADARAIVLTVTVGERAVRIHAFNDGVAPCSSGPGAGIGLRLLAARALDHRGFVLAGATSSGGWSTTLTLVRPPFVAGVEDAPVIGMTP